MARTQNQILDSLQATLKGIDERIDLKVGPTWDYLLAPVPVELSPIESLIDRVYQYYSPSFAQVATPDEARDFSNNFGAGSSVGEYATTYVIFYRNSAPVAGIAYIIPTGTLVLTADSNLAFSTLQSVTMDGNFASIYYNPTNKRYELKVLVQAVNTGERYNIPRGHLIRMQPRVDGIDGVAQITDAAGGTEPEDSVSLAQRTQDKFKGLDVNSMGGIGTRVKALRPTLVQQVAVVRPTDRMEFRRLTSGPALDIYVLGQSIVDFSGQYLGIGGETVVPFSVNRTVTAVSTVTVSGSALTSDLWTFHPDTSLEFQLSTRASPYIKLTSPLGTGDLVEIDGLRNSLLDTIQDAYLSENSLFGTDVLVRNFIDLPIVVNLEVKINSGDPDTVAQYIANVLYFVIEPSSTIPTILTPDMVKSQIDNSLFSIESLKFLAFKRQYGSIANVETITPYKNQIPKYNATMSTITVRS